MENDSSSGHPPLPKEIGVGGNESGMGVTQETVTQPQETAEHPVEAREESESMGDCGKQPQHVELLHASSSPMAPNQVPETQKSAERPDLSALPTRRTR